MVAVVGACSAPSVPFETVAKLPDAGHHPPGVSVDPAAELPPSAPEARTREGVVVLRSPADPAAVRGVVRDFFDALVEESVDELGALLSPQAVVISRSRRQAAREHYLARFGRLDYSTLRGERLYADSDVEITAPEPPPPSEAALAGALPERRIVRVRTSVAWGNRPRLFGDELVFALASRGGSWIITEIVEDF